MAGILIIAHAPLASALQEFTRHVYGEVPDRLKALDVMAHEDAKLTLERAVEAAQSIKSDKGLLVLTDIMGATPANVASRLAHMTEFAGHVCVRFIKGRGAFFQRSADSRGSSIWSTSD